MVGERIDRCLSRLFADRSRSEIQRWFDQECVLIDGTSVKKSHVLKANSILEITGIPELPPSDLEPENIPLDIRYQDEDILVVFKPKGLVVHPGNGIYTGTLAAGLLFHFGQLSEINGAHRPGIVHRLDRDTSGLMVVARNDFAHRHLSAQLQDRSVSRVYWALVWGQPEDSGTIDLPLDRDPRNRIKRAVVSGGKEARTHFRVLKRFSSCSLLELKLETGRTHQIRVHLSHQGYPILGDALYGGGSELLSRTQPFDRGLLAKVISGLHSQALQARELTLVHPRTQVRMTFDCELESEFSQALAQLEVTL